MFKIITVLLLVSAFHASKAEPDAPTSPINKEEPIRRDGISYSTSVIHTDPEFPDQQAQSSVDFQLGTASSEEVIATKPHTTYTTRRPGRKFITQTLPPPQTTAHTFSSQTSEVKHTPPPSSPVRGSNIIRGKINHQQHSEPAPQKKQQRKNEGVVVASSPPQKQRQVNHHQRSHQKPNPSQHHHVVPAPSPPNYPKSPKTYNPQSQSQSFNVGYSVKFGNDRGNERGKPYKAHRGAESSDIITGSHKEEVKKPAHLDDAQPQHTKIKYTNAPKHVRANNYHHHTTPSPSTHQQPFFDGDFEKEIEQQVQAAFQSAPVPTWQNANSGIEIVKSQEIPFKFDHDKALGKSEGFDYSNAVDFKAQFPKSTPTDGLKSSKTSPSSPIPAIPKLQLDTSLLREPVITLQKQPLNVDPKRLPIHFDTTLLQEMEKQQQQYYNFRPPYEFDSSNAGSNPVPIQVAEQSQVRNFYQPKPQFEDSSPEIDGGDIKFGYPQNGLFNPVVQKYIKEFSNSGEQGMYKVNEHVDDTPPQQQHHIHHHQQGHHPHPQYKVISKPGNVFMRHEFEKMKKQARYEPRHPRQQPRIQPKRIVREYMEYDLKPPPMPYKVRLRKNYRVF